MNKFNEIFNYEVMKKIMYHQELTRKEKKVMDHFWKKTNENYKNFQKQFFSILELLAAQVNMVGVNKEVEDNISTDLISLSIFNRFDPMDYATIEGEAVQMEPLKMEFEDYQREVSRSISIARAYIILNQDVLEENLKNDPYFDGILNQDVIKFFDTYLHDYMNWMKYMVVGENMINILFEIREELEGQELLQENMQQYEELIEKYDAFRFDDCVQIASQLYEKIEIPENKKYLKATKKILKFCKERLVEYKLGTYMYPKMIVREV